MLFGVYAGVINLKSSICRVACLWIVRIYFQTFMSGTDPYVKPLHLHLGACGASVMQPFLVCVHRKRSIFWRPTHGKCVTFSSPMSENKLELHPVVSFKKERKWWLKTFISITEKNWTAIPQRKEELECGRKAWLGNNLSMKHKVVNVRLWKNVCQEKNLIEHIVSLRTDVVLRKHISMRKTQCECERRASYWEKWLWPQVTARWPLQQVTESDREYCEPPQWKQKQRIRKRQIFENQILHLHALCSIGSSVDFCFFFLLGTDKPSFGKANILNTCTQEWINIWNRNVPSTTCPAHSTNSAFVLRWDGYRQAANSCEKHPRKQVCQTQQQGYGILCNLVKKFESSYWYWCQSVPSKPEWVEFHRWTYRTNAHKFADVKLRRGVCIRWQGCRKLRLILGRLGRWETWVRGGFRKRPCEYALVPKALKFWPRFAKMPSDLQFFLGYFHCIVGCEARTSSVMIFTKMPYK